MRRSESAATAPVTIHVASSTIGDAVTIDALAGCVALLDGGEVARLERFLRPRSKVLFAAAHGLLRVGLGAFTGIEPAALVFEAGEYGKPFVSGPGSATAAQVSLSHTDGLVAAAWTDGGVFGLDVQHAGRSRDLPGVAQRVYTDAERAEMDGLGDPGSPAWIRRFYTLWTAKEAWLKACGTGFSRSPQTCELVVRDDDVHIAALAPELADDPGGWTIASWWDGLEHAGAVAMQTHGAPIEIVHHRVDCADIASWRPLQPSAVDP